MSLRPHATRPITAEPAAESPRPGRWLGLAVLLVAGLAWWAGRDEPTDPDALAPAYASPLGPPPELRAAAPAPSNGLAVAAVPVAPAPEPACLSARIGLLLEGRLQSSCIGPAVALQNGSLRSHRAEGSGAGARWVQVDTAGDALVAVTVGRGNVADYACEAADCTGVTVGAPDRHGQRDIAFADVPLTRQPGAADDAADPRTLLRGQFASTLPHAQAGDACATPSLWLEHAAATATQPFCAQDGIAVEQGDDGGHVHRFASLDSPPIAVTTGADGTLARIEFGSLACAGPQCAGALLAPGAEPGALELSLNGTVLLPTDARGGWARLSGRLAAP